jgi:hypothetical protein
MKIYRQGDVLLQQIDRIPTDAQLVDTNGAPVVVAEGEATGHKHQFRFRDAEMYRGGGGAQYIRALTDAPLTHEEHQTVVLPPGIYKRIQQVEYSPAALRTVAD